MDCIVSEILALFEDEDDELDDNDEDVANAPATFGPRGLLDSNKDVIEEDSGAALVGAFGGDGVAEMLYCFIVIDPGI